MLNKLMKYELKISLKNMAVFYILSIFFALLTRILFSLNQTTFIYFLGQVSLGTIFTMVINIIINTTIRSWVRFRENLYKDESYLTHTLPVTKKELYESKFLQNIIFSFVGFLVIIISLLIVYYTKERLDSLITLFNDFSKNTNYSLTLLLTLVIVILFLEIYNITQCGFLGIILGNRHNDKKNGYSFVYGFISYFLTQLTTVLIFFLYGLFNKEIMDLFITNTMPSVQTLMITTVIGILSYAFVIFITNVLCVKFLNKGVNVE